MPRLALCHADGKASFICLAYLLTCLIPYNNVYVPVNLEIQINWKKYPEFQIIDQSQPGKLHFCMGIIEALDVDLIQEAANAFFMRYFAVDLSQDKTFQ